MEQLKKTYSFGIRQKVLFVLMSVLLVALSLSGWLALQQEKENVVLETNQRGNDIARFVAKSLAYSIVGYDYQTIQLLLDEIIRSEEISYAMVTNQRKKEMGLAGAINDSNRAYIKIFNENILLEDEVVGELTLGLSTEKIVERLEENKFSLVTREALIIMLIAIGEFIALSFIIIKPVRLISQSLDNGVDENGKIVADIPIRSSDEFGQLAQKFNELGTDLNKANLKLQNKIEAADDKLKDTNDQLLKQQVELKQINEELRLISITDPLTGLYNRRHFEDLVGTEIDISIRHGDKNSLIMIDIDHFKSINDTYGHFSGDVVLKVVSETLKEQLRKTDVLCRIGGEEFVVLCKRADKDQTLIIAEKLRTAIKNKHISLGDKAINICISLGGATIDGNQSSISIDELYRYADSALYFSKENGRNRYTHYDDLNQNTVDEAAS